MKKWILRIFLAAVVLLVLAVACVALFLDSAIKKGIETVGPMLTKVDVKLDSVSLSLFSGSGTVKGLLVGNPQGYQAPSAIQVGLAELAIKPASLIADKIVIRNINLQAPEITFETDLKGNNLSKLLSNVQAATGGDKPAASPETNQKASRKLQVDNLRVTGGKLHVRVSALGEKSATVALPDIQLTDLGTGPDGITAAELTKRLLQEIEKVAVPAAMAAATDLNKQLGDLTRGLDKNPSGAINEAAKGIGSLLNKKK